MKLRLPRTLPLLWIIGFCIGAMGTASAHVPYFENRDYTLLQPYLVSGPIEQSIAVYAWLQPDATTNAMNGAWVGDVDVYRMDVAETARIYLQVLVPVCAGYEEFAPWFALAGPGLPAPPADFPFFLPEGYGAVVGRNTLPGEPRNTFYEPFGGKHYYEGPEITTEVDRPGVYFALYWDPYGKSGDYVAVIGDLEIWNTQDVLRALLLTPRIRADEELHIECTPPPGM